MPLPRPQLPLALAWKSGAWTGHGPSKPTALGCIKVLPSDRLFRSPGVSCPCSFEVWKPGSLESLPHSSLSGQ